MCVCVCIVCVWWDITEICERVCVCARACAVGGKSLRFVSRMCVRVVGMSLICERACVCARARCVCGGTSLTFVSVYVCVKLLRFVSKCVRVLACVVGGAETYAARMS